MPKEAPGAGVRGGCEFSGPELGLLQERCVLFVLEPLFYFYFILHES